MILEKSLTFKWIYVCEYYDILIKIYFFKKMSLVTKILYNYFQNKFILKLCILFINYNIINKFILLNT